jgi:hypothetical protein
VTITRDPDGWISLVWIDVFYICEMLEVVVEKDVLTKHQCILHKGVSNRNVRTMNY